MFRATTITISRILSSEAGEEGGTIGIRQTKHTFIYKSIAMKSSTKQPKNVKEAERKMISQFFHHHLWSLFEQKQKSETRSVRGK